MKWMYWAALLPCLACVATAAALVLRQQDGWGWFLFGAFFLSPTMKIGGGR